MTEKHVKIPALIAVILAAALVGLLFKAHSLRNRNQELSLAAERLSPLAERLSGGLKEHGQLKVEHGRLLNQKGQAVQLKGMSSHGLIWFPQYAGARALLDLRGRGANLFRAAMYADSIHEGYNENSNTKRLNKSLMYLAVENALAADMYVIVDWHLLLDQNPMLKVDAAIEFFDEISSRYPSHPGLIYEICNEPNGDTTWWDIYHYANRVIPVIRQNSPQAVILVGTPKFSSDILSVRQAPLNFQNIMYTFHFYAGESGFDYRAAIGAMQAEGHGVFISEWGIGSPEGSSRPALAEAAKFIEFMNEANLSWANWSLSNKAEIYSAIKPDVQKLSGWTDADLTPSGRLVFQALSQ